MPVGPIDHHLGRGRLPIVLLSPPDPPTSDHVLRIVSLAAVAGIAASVGRHSATPLASHTAAGRQARSCRRSFWRHRTSTTISRLWASPRHRPGIAGFAMDLICSWSTSTPGVSPTQSTECSIESLGNNGGNKPPHRLRRLTIPAQRHPGLKAAFLAHATSRRTFTNSLGNSAPSLFSKLALRVTVAV